MDNSTIIVTTTVKPVDNELITFKINTNDKQIIDILKMATAFYLLNLNADMENGTIEKNEKSELYLNKVQNLMNSLFEDRQ